MSANFNSNVRKVVIGVIILWFILLILFNALVPNKAGSPDHIESYNYDNQQAQTIAVRADGYNRLQGSNQPNPGQIDPTGLYFTQQNFSKQGVNFQSGNYFNWTNSNISVQKDQPIDIAIEGSIYTDSNKNISVQYFDPTIRFQNDPNYIVNINGEDNNISRVYVQQGDFVAIEIGQSSGKFANQVNWCVGNGITNYYSNYDNTAPYVSDVNKQNWGSLGAGVGFQIGTIPLNDYNKQFVCQKNYIGSDARPPNCGSFTNDSFNNNDAHSSYFYSTNGTAGFYIPEAPTSGYLNFQAFDSDNNYLYDNQGGYVFNVRVISAASAVSSSSSNITTTFNGLNSNNDGALEVAVNVADPGTIDNFISPITPITQNNSTITSPATGTIWYRVLNHDKSYNFLGNYFVTAKASNIPNGVSSDLIANVITPVKAQLNAARQIIYNSFVGQACQTDVPMFQIFMRMLNVYIIFYALFFMFGLIQINALDLVKRLFKIGVLLNLLNSTTSWNFFNENLFKIFEQGSEYLMQLTLNSNVINSGPYDANSIMFERYLFQFVDDIMGNLWTSNSMAKISSLMMTPIFFMFGIFLIYAMVILTLAVIEAVIAYLFSLIAISLLFCVAPIFLMFALFDRTKDMFNRWIKYLFNFAFQPVFLFLMIIFIYRMSLQTFFNAISNPVHWGCALKSSILGIPAFGNFCILQGYIPSGDVADISSYLAPKIFVCYIFAKLMQNANDFAPRIANILTEADGMQFGGQGSPADKAMKSASDPVKGALGQSNEAISRRKREKSSSSYKGNYLKD